MAIKSKLMEWSRRYIPAECAAIAGTLIAGIIIHITFNNVLLTSIAAAWGDNLGFYSWVLYSELKATLTKHKKITKLSLITILRNIIVEFGPSEMLDSIVIRPVAMYTFPLLIQNLTLGLLLGKVFADTVFYSLTIGAFELRKKYLQN